MPKKRQRNEIVIERNIVERILMLLKDYIREYRKILIYSIAAVFLVLIIVIGISLYIDKTTTKNQIVFESILTRYEKAVALKDEAKIKNVITDLNELIKSSSFGFAHEMSYYLIANIYFDNKQYKEAKEHYLEFIDESSKNIFSDLSLVKTAVCEENIGNYDEALKIYKKLEMDRSDSVVIPQVIFNMGNVYELKKDYINAKQYYNMVMTSYPQSIYAKKANKRIFLMAVKIN